MTTTDKYLAEVKARAEKATPGPWVANHGDATRAGRKRTYSYVQGNEGFIFDRCHNIKTRFLANKEDAEFIAHARTDIPRLISMAEAAQIWFIAPGHECVGATKCAKCSALAELDRIAAGDEK